MDNILTYLLLTLSLLFVLGAIGFFTLWKKFRSRRQKLLQQIQVTYEMIPAARVFKTSTIDHEILKTSLDQLLQQEVSSIYFVHGTFVGEDPLHLITLMESIFPNAPLNIYQRFKIALRKSTAGVAGDFGNFTKKHLQLIQQNSSITPYEFTWSSGNHHLARVKGCFKLMEHIHHRHKGDEHVLIMGHSHAGQLLALMTRFMQEPDFRDQILALIENDLAAREEIISHIKFCKKLRFTFCTFGTPVRYQWNLSPKTELIHFINHRGPLPFGHGPVGAAFTRGGDYIQQWATAGSDIISPVYSEYKLNLELDRYLGIGFNLKIFATAVNSKRRLHNQGHHFLVDYKDQAAFPNFLMTMFGHVAYTRASYFAFQMQLIACRLTGPKS